MRGLFYVSFQYLKALHYFFFFLSLLSMVLGVVFFDIFFAESIALLLLFAFYLLLTLVTAHYFYKSYRESAEAYFVIRQHSVSYVVLSLLTIVSVFALVYFYPDLIGLFYSVYFINYYYFFIVIVGLALSRFHVASRLFRVYGKRSLEKALEVAKKQARIPELKKYKIGKSPEIDQMLDRVAENKSNVKPTVREIEVKILDKRIADLEKNLGDLLSKKNPTQPERHKIKLLERQVVFSRKSMDEIREKREK